MFRRLIAPLPPEVRAGCAYVLLLLVPGSCLLIPVLWLARRYGGAGGWLSALVPARMLRSLP